MKLILIAIGAAIVFWGIAAILFVCARYVNRSIDNRKNECTMKTTATVRDVQKVRRRVVDDYSYTWYPVYEFYANGQMIVQKSVIGTGKKSVQKGQQVTLYYNPDNPQMIYVPAEKPDSISTILRIIGTLFIVCGFLPIVIIAVLMYKDVLPT